MALNLSRKVYFLQFCADFSQKPKSVKAINIFHLKVLTTLFQKIIWLIGVWAIPYEILAIKISKNKFNEIIWFQTLISPKTVSYGIINYHFLKVQKRDLSAAYMEIVLTDFDLTVCYYVTYGFQSESTLYSLSWCQ